MNSVKILHCADIHIGAAESFLGTLAEKRRFETLLTFERIIDVSVKENVDIIAIAGDLFDSNNIESPLIDAVFNKIASIPQIKVIYCAGNHDPLDTCSPFLKRKLPQNLFVLKTKDDMLCFDDLKLRVYGKSFSSCYESGEKMFSLTPHNDEFINLMVIHGELKSDLNSNYNAITPAFIKSSNMDYIALGHIHKKSDIGKLGDTYFAYPGCPEGQGFDETDEKGVYIGEISKENVNLKFLPVYKRCHCVVNIDITSLLSAEQIMDKIISVLNEIYGENYPQNLYKIILTGEIDKGYSLPITEIISRLSERVFFAKIQNKTEIKFDRNLLANEHTLKGIFVKNMLNKISVATDEEKDIFENALRLGLKAFSGEVNFDDN